MKSDGVSILVSINIGSFEKYSSEWVKNTLLCCTSIAYICGVEKTEVPDPIRFLNNHQYRHIPVLLKSKIMFMSLLQVNHIIDLGQSANIHTTSSCSS